MKELICDKCCCNEFRYDGDTSKWWNNEENYQCSECGHMKTIKRGPTPPYKIEIGEEDRVLM
jgi:hypothetical protein